ncbi:MAG: Pyridoxal-5'-phosphate-dependent protein beta subunit [Bacteroidetes bacterium]|nr:Pyridoxal-5'-phosphate-dependent protein beta subunit [Bacteroidota bacterium]
MLTNSKQIRFHENILETIGGTPLIKLNRIAQGYKPQIFVKVEFFNPGGSVKDRIGLVMIEEAEREGRLKPGGTIVEATSGNTGMGLAIAAALKGYKCVFTMPDKMSIEKIRLLRAFGAEVIVTPTAVPHESPESYTEVAKRIVRETPNSILANQYYNPKNPEAHYQTTGPEIWEQTGGQIDYFVCGIGTGGTISGVGKYLKEKNPGVKIVGVDPRGSLLRDYFYTKKLPTAFSPYKIEGIGQDFVPGALHFEFIDEMIEVTDKESFLMARRMTREEGMFVGGSSGTAIAGTLKLAERLSEKDVVVALLPDTGERYLSKIYNDDWMRENRFLIPEKITLRYVLQAKRGVNQLISIDPVTTVRKALDLLSEHNVSQLPVIDNGQPVGSVEESELMSSVLESPALFDAPVSSLMEAAFPVVHIEESINQAIALLSKKHPAVLVQDDGKIVGIVTRFDVIEYMSR